MNEAMSRSARKEIASILSSVVNGKRNLDSKYELLWRAADILGQYASKVSACRKGCSHCCHIAVSMSHGEAEMIGRRIKKTPNAVPSGLSESFRDEIGQPCVFLKNGACSIYENRPLACRAHFNLDRDDLLCRLIPGADVPVPYLNAQEIFVAYAVIDPRGMSTLRAFFKPAGE